MSVPTLAGHEWWLASRAAGVVALVLVSASVGLGLVTAARLLPPSMRRAVLTMHEQTALAAGINRREAGDGRGDERAGGIDDSQPARPLGDQHLPARQKRDGPGTLQRRENRCLVERDVRLPLRRVVLTSYGRLLMRRFGRARIEVWRLREDRDARNQEG